MMTKDEVKDLRHLLMLAESRVISAKKLLKCPKKMKPADLLGEVKRVQQNCAEVLEMLQPLEAYPIVKTKKSDN